MRSVFLISAAITLTLAGAASAQTTDLSDDRFKPRVYGNLGAAQPAYQGITVEIYQPEATPTTTSSTITRVVEPVEPSVTSMINAPVVYDENGVMQAQHFKQSDLTPEQYEALLNEADRVRTYQDTSYESTTYDAASTADTYNGAYEIDLYAPQTTVNSAPITTTMSLHTVVKGDTLYSLSKRFGTSVAAIQDENGLSGTILSLGQALRIPAASIPAQSLNATMAQPIFASAPVQQGYVTRRVVQPVSTSATPSNYAVLPKDTLYAISRRTCVSPADLISANSLANPNQLTPGQLLTLPSGHCLAN